MKSKREPELEDYAALLLAALPAPIPDYDPKIEITRADLARRNNFSKAKAGIWLQAKVNSGEWIERQVMVGGRRATAYRPVKA